MKSKIWFLLLSSFILAAGPPTRAGSDNMLNSPGEKVEAKLLAFTRRKSKR